MPPSVTHPLQHVHLSHSEPHLTGDVVGRDSLFEEISCPPIGLTTAVGEFLPLAVGSRGRRIYPSASSGASGCGTGGR